MTTDAANPLRKRAEQGIADLLPDALAVLGAVLREPKAQRNVGAKLAAARYVLDAVLQLAAALEQQDNTNRAGHARLSPEAAMIELRRRLSRASPGINEPRS